MKESAGPVRSILSALTANFLIAISKFIAAAFTGSSAMFAEGIHSMADCLNQVLLLIGLKEAKKPADADHPMGYGKVSYFYSMMVALLLFLLGGIYSTYTGVIRLISPEPLRDVPIALIVLLFSAALEGKALLFALKEVKKQAGKKSFYQWWRETRQSELIVVTGEDIGALMGLTVSFIFLSLAWLTGNPVYDAIGTLCVGLILMVVSFMVLKEVKAMITSESADPQMRIELQKFLESRPEIKEVLEVITLTMGEKIMVSIKADMAEKENATKMVDEINIVEDAIKQKWPNVAWTFFEPDHARKKKKVKQLVL